MMPLGRIATRTNGKEVNKLLALGIGWSIGNSQGRRKLSRIVGLHPVPKGHHSLHGLDLRAPMGEALSIPGLWLVRGVHLFPDPQLAVPIRECQHSFGCRLNSQEV